MSILAVIGWVLVGAIGASILTAFWNEISSWLNNVAADAVERVFGYKARAFMHRATARVSRVVDKIRNKSTVYTKKNDVEPYFYKTDIIAEQSQYNISPEVLEAIKNEGVLTQEFQYKR